MLFIILANITPNLYKNCYKVIKFVDIKNMKDLVENIQVKVKNVISLYESVKNDNNKFLTENNILKEEIASNKKMISDLEEKIDLLRISKSAQLNDSDNLKESRKKIDQYVREIDKCIALLNK